MNYEQKYKEALNDVRVIYPNLKGDAKLAMEHAFPELRESEDERIRKFLVELLSSGTWKKEWPFQPNECVAYLEKQKEPDLTEEVKEWKKDFDRLRKEHYGQNSSVWKSPIMTHEMIMEEQKEQDKCPEYCVRSHCIGCPIYEKQKEQKPAEWSEEDEKMLKRIIERGQSQIQMFETGLTPEQVSWLKSLRPSWKPSEEQMKALDKVVNGDVLLTTQYKSLESLYEQLKAL